VAVAWSSPSLQTECTLGLQPWPVTLDQGGCCSQFRGLLGVTPWQLRCMLFALKSTSGLRFRSTLRNREARTSSSHRVNDDWFSSLPMHPRSADLNGSAPSAGRARSKGLNRAVWHASSDGVAALANPGPKENGVRPRMTVNAVDSAGASGAGFLP
jgi:hypothetical protein